MRGQGLTGIRTLPLFAAVAVAACAVLLGGGAASASQTGNHTVWTDPVGDNQRQSSSVYASDIQKVELTSQDSGAIEIAVTLVDGDAKLVNGDQLEVLIDYDRNQSTGQSGFDIDLVATGHSGSATTFLLCRLGSTRSCEEGPTDWAQDTKTATGTHVVDFNVSAGVAAFDFGVIESYTSGSTTLTDTAPDSGLWTFEIKADPDNDGVQGTADKCPTVAARGKFDKNHNGCPGPFSLIKGQLHSAITGPRPGFLQVQKLWLTGVPPGASVVISSPRGVEHLKAKSSGKASSKRICCGARGPEFRLGSKITVRITKPGFVGVLDTNVVQRRGVLTASHRCIPATGGAPVKCSGKLKGS